MTGPELRHVGLRRDRYESLEPGEAETEMFGFWIFLMSDAVLFALVCALRRPARCHRGRPGTGSRV